MNAARRMPVVGVLVACLIVVAPVIVAPVVAAPAVASPPLATPAVDGTDGPMRNGGGEARPTALRSDVAPGASRDESASGAGPGGSLAAPAVGVVPDRPATPVTMAGSPSEGVGTGTSTTSNRGGSASGPTSAASGQLELTQSLALTPDQPGEIAVTLSYEVPDQVTELSTEVPRSATVVETKGFDEAGETSYEWTGATASPSLTYRLPANVTGEGPGPVSTSGEYIFVDKGPWALVRIPSTPTSWRYRGTRPRFVRDRTTAGPGATGEAVAFLGEHAVHARHANGQRFRLVVPAAATMEESPDAVLGALAAAADTIHIGNRDEQVFFVAAPSDGVTWGVRGLQTGPADAWVRDSQGLDEVSNVWIHEYVHTRQGWTETEGTRWVTEASATYYAALLALERGQVQYSTFRERLVAGTRSPQSSSILARPDSWRNAANYQKGALVAAELDRRIRLASDGRRSLQNVLRAMNEHGEPVTTQAFISMVADAGNDSVRNSASRFTTTEAAPSTWDQDAHEAAFGATPAYLEVALADEHGVSGPYRNRTLRGNTLTLVPGETLTVEATVHNAGGVADDYLTTFGVDGEPRATRSGEVEPNETVRLTYEQTFAEVGTHAVTVGDVTLDVEVRRPAEASVTGLTVDRSTVEPGAPVTITATVRNGATVPGERTVAVRVDGRTVATRKVQIDAGERRQVTATTSFDAPGSYQIDAGGDDQITVVVESPETPTPTPAPATGDGFGVAVGLLGIALLVSGLRANSSDGGVLGVGHRREQ